MNQSSSRRKAPADFIRIEEFPVNPELEERILEMMRLGEEGELSDMDEMIFEQWIEDEHKNAFATAGQLAALQSWKEMLRSGRQYE
ncbi:MAG: hypothetical protein IT365_29430 [Candidatus Hydrogenedentes bacterium]|nr:hypothetical protein [Candidatus Hydrogenedentota bacterium]